MRNDDYEFYSNENKLNERRQREAESKSEYARQKLKKTIKISIETASIGALNDMEEELGFVWLHGRPYKELTDDEKDMRDRWLDARDSILKRCANSVRLALKEVDRCSFNDYQEKRYNTIIKPKNNNGEDIDGRY